MRAIERSRSRRREGGKIDEGEAARAGETDASEIDEAHVPELHDCAGAARAAARLRSPVTFDSRSDRSLRMYAAGDHPLLSVINICQSHFEISLIDRIELRAMID
jgi:hypothetical protein